MKISRKPIFEILEENRDLVRSELRERLRIKSKRRRRNRYTNYRGRNDRYAICQDLWKAINIEIHRTRCMFVPEYITSSTIRWLFVPTLKEAVAVSKRLGKEHGMKYAKCQHCKPFE